MCDAARQPTDRLHLLALPQRLLDLLAMGDLAAKSRIGLGQFLVGAAQDHVGGAQDRGQDPGHAHQQAHAGVARQAPGQRLQGFAQGDAAQARAGLDHRHGHLDRRARVPTAPRVGVMAQLGPAVAGHLAAPLVEQGGVFDLGIGPQGADELTRGVAVVEGQGRRHAGGHDLGLHRRLAGLLGSIGLVAEHADNERGRHQDRPPTLDQT